MPAHAACAEVEGSGCGGGPTSVCPTDTGDSADTVSDQAYVAGGGCTCATAPGPSWLAVGLFVVWFARRGRRALPLLLLAAAPLAHAEETTQANEMSPQDGGAFPLLRDADLGPPNTPRVTLSGQLLVGPVRLVTPDRAYTVVDQAVVTELGASWRFGQLGRVGFAVDLDHVGPSDAYADAVTLVGNPTAWVSASLHDSPTLSVAATVQGDFPSGAAERWLGEPALRAHLGVGVDLHPPGWHLLLDADLSLASPTELVGLTWGSRLAAGLGAQRQLFGPLHATVEAFGSVGLEGASGPNDTPIELDGGVGLDLHGFGVDVGGGAGLTAGLGAPESRAFLSLSARRRREPDTDGDGLPDVVDRCPVDPEDLDGVQDHDGCPEDDPDADGFADAVDHCPVHAETRNGWRDDDGCPDVVTTVLVTVTSTDAETPVEQATVRLASGPPVTAMGGDPTPVLTDFPTFSLHVEAPGFVPVDRPMEAPRGASVAVAVALDPVRTGTLTVHVHDDAGPLAATWLEDDAAVGIPVDGLERTVLVGPHTARVFATGHLPADVVTRVERDTLTTVDVHLDAASFRFDHGTLHTDATTRFALDDATVLDPGPLDDVLRLLHDRPDITLLRVEGHADSPGTPAHNLDLSRRRAEAARDWLVQPGIASGRLEVVASGEGTAQDRAVDFTVLVWDDRTPL